MYASSSPNRCFSRICFACTAILYGKIHSVSKTELESGGGAHPIDLIPWTALSIDYTQYITFSLGLFGNSVHKLNISPEK